MVSFSRYFTVCITYQPPLVYDYLSRQFWLVLYFKFKCPVSLKCTALLVERSLGRFPVVSLGIFSLVPPTEPCALRLTQPLKVSTRDFSWRKGGRCVWLTNYHPCSAETSRKSWALTYPDPLGPPRPVAEDFYFYHTFTCYTKQYHIINLQPLPVRVLVPLPLYFICLVNKYIY